MTHAERIKKAFDPYCEVPVQNWETFVDYLEDVYFEKNEIIKRPWETEKYGYFLLEGSCGVFIWKENNYVCLDLIPENNFFADHMSLITQQPTPIETMALERCHALRITKSSIDYLKSFQGGAMLFLIGAEYSFVEKQQQQIDLLLKTPEQRYIEILEKSPKMIQNTAQKYIASYLGITTQSLSRIRKRIMKKRN
ncbi:MAG: Crp/Fnr family transcriptional regulator [Spirosomataceae bacterium]